MIYIHLISREDLFKDLTELKDDDGDFVFKNSELKTCTDEELEIIYNEYFRPHSLAKFQIEDRQPCE